MYAIVGLGRQVYRFKDFDDTVSVELDEAGLESSGFTYCGQRVKQIKKFIYESGFDAD